PEKSEDKREDFKRSSTDVAEKLNTNLNVVLKAAEQLARKKLITVEDDATEDQTKLTWYSLTPEGRAHKVEPPAEKQKLPGSAPGPSPKFAGRFVFRLVKENPRRPGTHGYNSFKLISDGMTYEEYRRLGGRNNDLQWDIDHKWVEMRDEAASTSAPEP